MVRVPDAPRQQLFTLPNLVSTSRVVLAIGFAASDAVPVRLALIGAASFTDVLDGWLARRTRTMSRIGALVDPIADRLFVLGVVISYLIGGQLSWWQAVLLMFRDVMSVIGWFVARNVSWLRPITFQARLIGKIVTVAQLATFLAVLLAPPAVPMLVWLVGLLGLGATIDYTLMLWRRRVRDDNALDPT
jgi:cardiolipin synthase (CMP-forming)